MTEELKDPAEYDDFAAAISHNERVTTRRYDSVGPVKLETVYETIIHWDEGGGKRSRRELARRIVDLYTAPPQPAEPIEPVAWMYEDTLPKEYPYDAMWPHSAVRDGVRMFPVFAPPQRLPLTEEEINRIDACIDESTPLKEGKSLFARAIENASWEKNRGQA